MRDYAFMKVDKEALAAAKLDAEPDRIHVEAQRRFLVTYGLPEFEGDPLHPAALSDLAQAMKARRLPYWALSLLEKREIKQIGEVMTR